MFHLNTIQGADLLKFQGVKLMIMLMKWDYICELRPSTGLLFILQVIYGHGEPWWNDINKEKLLIRLPALSGNPISSHLIAKQEDLVKEMMNLVYEIYFEGSFNMLLGLTAFLPVQRKVCCRFLLPLKSITHSWV
jgi:hypothetical protein